MWVFGYGSLIWDGWEGEFGCTRKETATLRGYRRDFNKASVQNWGSDSTPGPTLGLEPLGEAECVGLAFEFPPTERERVLQVLRAREGPSFALEEKDVQLASGPTVRALVAVNDRSRTSYLGKQTVEERAKLAATAAGSSGLCRDYVKNIRDRLEALEIRDQAVEEFAAFVAKAHRYDAALERNLAETSNAILKRRALIGLHSADSSHGLDFFQVAAHALYNDLIAHSLRVFDRHPDVASFWYVVRCDEASARSQASSLGVNLDELGVLADKLKNVRDKTLFHIDKKAVTNPKLVWSSAEITGDALGSGLEGAFRVFAGLYFQRHGVTRTIPDYDGSDAPKIIRAYKQVHPEVAIVV
ncbi:MAG TPA: gamma-glutamylcyclotransferase [Blastocatellia bacterium]|nr:gamma-glutamylcyclotransferase [Blastocatellia bacterium]